MMRRGYVFGLFLGGLLLSQSAQAKIINLDGFELDNGLKVFVMENHKAPVIYQMLYYKTGAFFEPKGKEGISHLVEHLMFRGTKEVTTDKYQMLMKQHGVVDNAYTDINHTGYYYLADKAKLDLLLAIEADRMENLEISMEAFKQERDIVLQEKKQKLNSNPSLYFYEMLTKNLWQEYPLRSRAFGSDESLNGLKLHDVKAFYRRYYRPDNAVLVMAGDITVDEAKEKVIKYFGKIKTREVNIKLPLRELENINLDIVGEMEGVTQSRLVGLVRIEPEDMDFKKKVALEILKRYMSYDDSSFLDNKLVYQDKLLTHIYFGTSYHGFGGEVVLELMPKDEKKPLSEIKEKLLKAFDEGIKAMSEEKILEIKNQMKSDVVYLLDAPDKAVRDFVGEFILDDVGVEDIMAYDEAIMNVSLQDIKDVYAKIFHDNSKVFGYLKPKNKGE